MIRLAVVVLFFFAVLAGSLLAAAEAPAQDVSECIILHWNADRTGGTFEVCDVATPTPWPTWTPEATVTHEPTPTVTPSRTPTATPTATPPIEPSPTVEDLRTPSATPPPTATPTPTVTSTPQPGICYGTTTANLWARVEPGGMGLSVLPAGSILRLEATWIYNDDVWYQHYYLPGQVAYSHGDYIALGVDADCSDIPDVTPQEAHNAALLWHTVPGFNIGNARTSYGILDSKGVAFGLKPYAGLTACVEALELGGVCVYRHGAPDCPQNIGSADPRQSAREFVQYGQAARQYLAGYANAYYEPVNECNFGGPESDASVAIIDWWRDWMDEYITRWTAQTSLKLVLPTFGPGHGDPVQYRIWRDVLNRLAAAGGVMGEHAYTPYHDGGLCECDKWLACRHRTNEAYRQAEGVDIDVAITEAARGWGNDTVSVSDFVCWYEIVRHDDWLHSVSLWTSGFHPTWPNANLDAFMVPIAQGVR